MKEIYEKILMTYCERVLLSLGFMHFAVDRILLMDSYVVATTEDTIPFPVLRLLAVFVTVLNRR